MVVAQPQRGRLTAAAAPTPEELDRTARQFGVEGFIDHLRFERNLS